MKSGDQGAVAIAVGPAAVASEDLLVELNMEHEVTFEKP